MALPSSRNNAGVFRCRNSLVEGTGGSVLSPPHNLPRLRMGSCRPFFTAKIKGQPVVTADGRAIDSADVLGPSERRKKLVVMGDTETTDGLAEHVRKAEPHGDRSNLLERDAAMALDYGYLTAAKAAELAATAGVKQLVLTHISAATPTRRYWRRRQK